MKWMATRHAPHGEPAAVPHAVLSDGQPRILRTRRREPARRGKERGKPPLVAADGRDGHAGRPRYDVRLPPRNSAERITHLGDEIVEVHGHRPRTADDHQCHPCGCGLARPPVRFPEPPPYPIALHRAAQLPTHGEADLSRRVRRPPEHDQGRSIDPLALLEERLEVGAPCQPLLSREPAGQTVSRLRPLARRRFSVLRPPCVFMRSRNPCVFARRRRFG